MNNIKPFILKTNDTLSWYLNRAEIISYVASHSGSGFDTTIPHTLLAPLTIKIDSLQDRDVNGLIIGNYFPATVSTPTELTPALTLLGTSWDPMLEKADTQSIIFYAHPDAQDFRTYLYMDAIANGIRHNNLFSIGITGYFSDSNGYKISGGSELDIDGLYLNTGDAISYTLTGSNRTAGLDTLSSGTKTISTTGIHTGDQIVFTEINTAGTPCATCGNLTQGTIVNSTSFVVNSSLNTDNHSFRWFIVR